ncbi:MAG: flagellar hook-basal body complex protein FliE [Steroidobacteraceae bacterium]
MAIDQVLAQIRAMSAQVRLDAPRPTPLTGPAPGGAAPAGGPSEFASILKKGIDAVNTSEQRANALADAFSRGAPGVSLPQVVLQMEKASISFRALTEVRNRLISAYQDIMNMQM